MKVKSLATSFLVLAVGAGGAAAAKLNRGEVRGAAMSAAVGGKAGPLAPPARATAAPPSSLQSDPNTIDGSRTPELIPDQVAYSLLFRFLSGRETAEAKGRARSYLATRVFGCKDCTCDAAASDPAARARIEALIAAAEEYGRQVTVLDAQAAHIRYEVPFEYHAAETATGTYPHLSVMSQPPPPPLTPSTKAQLAALQSQKEALVTQLIASLPGRLGAEGAAVVQKFMNEQFKRNVKYRRPGPGAAALGGNPLGD